MATLLRKFVRPPQTELVKRIPRQRLDKQLTEEELSLISEHILDWQSKAYGLGLSRSDVENIREDCKVSNKLQKIRMLLRWSEICGEKATLRELIQISRRHRWHSKFIVKVCKDLGCTSKDESSWWSSLRPYPSHLIVLLSIASVLLLAILLQLIYGNLASLSTQPPSLPFQLDTFVGRQEELRNLTKLLEYTSSDTPRIVSITGGPGFGKSTLAIHIGNELKDRGVDVIYVNMNEVPSVHVLTRKILSPIDSEIENSNKNVTLHHLYKWSKELQRETLLILDNCDEQFHINKDEFQNFITELVRKHSKYQTLKVLTTSRQQVKYLAKHELYILNELPGSHACVLLHNIANLSDSACRDITNLTGNVPLALHIIGALQNNVPHDKIVDQLSKNLIGTLSPEELPVEDRVNVSIHLSYMYLDTSVQKVGQILAHFPGSFDGKAACYVLTDIKTSETCQQNIQTLVRRSLLEYDSNYKRYNYHRLIREFFKIRSNFTNEFYSRFSEHFIPILEKMTERDFMKTVKTFDAERHNIHHLFKIDKQGKKVPGIFMKIAETINHNSNYKFTTPVELRDYLNTILLYFKENKDVMIKTFDKRKFVDVYSRLAMQLIHKIIMLEDDITVIQSMENYWQLFGKHESFISLDVYMEYHSRLAFYYEKNNDHDHAAKCHIRRIKELEKCNQEECSYFEIGNVYFHIKDYNNSAHFYNMELESMAEYNMKRAEILVKLYKIHAIMHPHNESKEKILLKIEGDIKPMLQSFLTIPSLISHGKIIVDLIQILQSNKRQPLSTQLEDVLIESIHNANEDETNELLFLLESLNENKREQHYHSRIIQNIGEKVLTSTNLNQSSFMKTLYYTGVAFYHLAEYDKSFSYLEKFASIKTVAYDFKLEACIYLVKMGSLKTVPLLMWTFLQYTATVMLYLPLLYVKLQPTIMRLEIWPKTEDFLDTQLVLTTSAVADHQTYSKRTVSDSSWSEVFQFPPHCIDIIIIAISILLFYSSLVFVIVLLSFFCFKLIATLVRLFLYYRLF